jgi:hypothetical protein
MRRICSALALLAALPLTAATPRPEDVPKTEPVTLGLAGDPRPDVLRYLYVQTASSPSLSPDGRQLAFRTDITGQRQL